MTDNGKVKLSEVRLGTPLTLIAHRDDVEVVNDIPNFMDITPENTLAMAAKFTDRTWSMAKIDEDFKSRLAIVYPDWDITKETRAVHELPIGYRHVIGLIVCTNMAINIGRQPFWRNPECYLHPATQSKLADLAVRYVNEGTTHD